MPAFSDENRLIAGILAGNTDDFSILVDRYGKSVYDLALRITANHEDAREIAQDAFVSAFEHLDGFRYGSRFYSWLYRIAYNISMDYLRKRRRRDSYITDTIEDIPEDNAGSYIDETEGFREDDIDLLHKAIEHLCADDRTVLSLFYYEDLPIKEIAFVLSRSETNVSTRIWRARRRLEAILNRMRHSDIR